MTGEDAQEIDVEQLHKLLTHVKSRRSKKFEAKCDYDTKESLVDRVVWHGGSESATFNRLEVHIYRKLNPDFLITFKTGDCNELISRHPRPQGRNHKSAGQSIVREKLSYLKVNKTSLSVPDLKTS